MKIVTVVGARPQFIKAAAVSRKLREECAEVLVHTGQHYDTNMSDIFFEELNIPKPDYNLGIGSGSHARQTAEMLIGIEQILQDEHPDYLMVYGDTNSTLAGALAASKILIPVVHVEAGLRSFNRAMPEEQNRILTDHLAEILFCPTDVAVDNLFNEGIIKNVYQIGDVMCDAVLYYSEEMRKHSCEYFLGRLRVLYGRQIDKLNTWYIATIHRAENTDSIYKIGEILSAFEDFTAPVIFPIHPRTRPLVDSLVTEKEYGNVIFVEPMGYLDMLFFTKEAVKVVTDSGGLQKEAYILGTDTVTVRDQTEWVETLDGNHNVLCKPQKTDILDKVYSNGGAVKERKKPYGDGHACERIADILEKGFTDR